MVEVTRPFVRQRASSAAGPALRVVVRALARRSARLAREQGVTRLRVVLSFDCDTERDIDVVTDVHDRCLEAGITPVYAVPGELLRRGADVYRSLADRGAELLNHGDVQHTSLDLATRVYTSSFFYDRLAREVIERDIRGGDRAVREVIGRAPQGFRTPHFGTFQGRSELRWLHALLASMGYRYSTSTMPLHGVRNGPLPAAGAVVEIPVSGRPSAPHRVLDSWSFRFAPGRSVDEDDWAHEVRTLLRLSHAHPTVINLYADPSQVEDWPAFFEVMAELAPYAVPSYAALLDEARR